MAIISGIIGAGTAAKAAGVNFGGITRGISGIFGGGNEPNAGNESFVDALDNYEEISTSRAKMLQLEIKQAVRGGANDRRVAQLVATAGGYTVNDVMSSWKWPIVTRFINEIRDRMDVVSQRPPVRVPAGVSGGSVGAGGSGGGGVLGGSGGGGVPQSVIWGAVGLVMIIVFQVLK